jgi:hypothetical protein
VKVVVAVVVLAAAATIAALTAFASSSTATRFTVAIDGGHESAPVNDAYPFGWRHVGTFTAGKPFCASGTFVDLVYDGLNGLDDVRLFTCGDGSGTVTLVAPTWCEHRVPYTESWRIVGGTGRYAELRGKGSYRGNPAGDFEQDPLTITFRSTLSGVADFDAVAPTITISSLKVTKLARPTRSYAIKATLSVRDNDTRNTISYFAAAEHTYGGLYLAQKTGSTLAGRVAVTLRVRPDPAAQALRLQLSAEDPVGNRRWLTRVVRLPR